jgi:hypothetical protein
MRAAVLRVVVRAAVLRVVREESSSEGREEE